jgi:hypothetical protein
MSVDSNHVPAQVDWRAAIDAAKEHNKALFSSGKTPELPGQGHAIPLRQCIGQPFAIKLVEFDASKYRDSEEYARLTVVFESDPTVERTVTASGKYVMNQLRKMSEDELTAYVWTVRELHSLKGKPIQAFQGYYPIVLDYADRPGQDDEESDQ